MSGWVNRAIAGEICNSGSGSKTKDKKKLDLFQSDRKKYEKIHQTVHKEKMYESHDFKFRKLLEEKEWFLKLIRFHLKCRNEKKKQKDAPWI